mmetsp:Transcript_20346/g.36993  ORF Transcript_20346/g.36993 Transcript_20346/m.36993 type:complete len:233 (-) Transcript_20346:382-1080(-)
MQQGPVAVLPQSSYAHSFPQAFVVMPQWATTTVAAPQWSPQVYTSCSPAAQQVERHEPCKQSKDLSLVGGVFGIAGVSQLPAASTASKSKPRKNKGCTMRFAPGERQTQKYSAGGRFGGAKARVEEQDCAAAAEQHADVQGFKAEAWEASEEPQCSSGSEPIAQKGCVASRTQADEKRRRWADIADDDDEQDACSSHPSESTRGSTSFSDYASTRGSTRGDCTDSEFSDVDA